MRRCRGQRLYETLQVSGVIYNEVQVAELSVLIPANNIQRNNSVNLYMLSRETRIASPETVLLVTKSFQSFPLAITFERMLSHFSKKSVGAFSPLIDSIA